MVAERNIQVLPGAVVVDLRTVYVGERDEPVVYSDGEYDSHLWTMWTQSYLEGHVVAVWLRGDWDGYAVTDRTLQFSALVTSSTTEHLIVDMSGVTFMGSPGINCLIQLRARFDRGHGRLHLSGIDQNRAVARVIDLCGIRSAFDIRTDVKQLVTDLTEL